MASSAASQPPGESLRDIFTRARHVACDEPLPASLAPDEPYATMQALRDMDKARAMVNSLDLFSTNESIEDVATRDLMYLLAPHYMSLLLQMAPVDIAIPRSRVVSQALTTSREFLSTCERMRIFPQGTPLGDALERDVHAAAPPPGAEGGEDRAISTREGDTGASRSSALRQTERRERRRQRKRGRRGGGT